jgi:hypothetical protein
MSKKIVLKQASRFEISKNGKTESVYLGLGTHENVSDDILNHHHFAALKKANLVSFIESEEAPADETLEAKVERLSAKSQKAMDELKAAEDELAAQGSSFEGSEGSESSEGSKKKKKG